MIDMQYISRVLRRFESRQFVAYVPCENRNFTGHNARESCGPVLGVSGVTVGTGLDLGQQSESGLRGMGIPEDLLDKLCPYIGLRRSAAIDALERRPLTLSHDEVDILDACVHRTYVERVAKLYDSERVGPALFSECPPQAQAVIASVFYQLGAYNGDPGYRTLWSHLVRQDWAAAVKELKTGFKRYPTRRRAEGEILEELV